MVDVGILREGSSTDGAFVDGREVVEKPLSKADQKLLAAAEIISGRVPTGDELAFMHAIFCQVGLPRSKVEGQSFLRKSGNAWLNVQAGMLDEGAGPVQQNLPFGATPRLALAHVSTYALRHNTREIPVGRNASQFLDMVGVTAGGKQLKNVRAQMHALVACHMQLGYLGRTFAGQAVEQFDAWSKDTDTNQHSLWPGVLVLSQRFYDSLKEGSVPLDVVALRALSGSAIALDIYAWLANRLHRLEGRGMLLHWKSVRDQFGGPENQGKNAADTFQETFKDALPKVLTVYPKAQVEIVRGGLYLRPSPPPVPPKALG